MAARFASTGEDRHNGLTGVSVVPSGEEGAVDAPYLEVCKRGPPSLENLGQTAQFGV